MSKTHQRRIGRDRGRRALHFDAISPHFSDATSPGAPFIQHGHREALKAAEVLRHEERCLATGELEGAHADANLPNAKLPHLEATSLCLTFGALTVGIDIFRIFRPRFRGVRARGHGLVSAG